MGVSELFSDKRISPTLEKGDFESGSPFLRGLGGSLSIGMTVDGLAFAKLAWGDPLYAEISKHNDRPFAVTGGF
jgi:hypothetical protein